MKLSTLPLLTAALLLVPATGLIGQSVGTAHPEGLPDETSLAPASQPAVSYSPAPVAASAADHYVKPSAGIPLQASPSLQPRMQASTTQAAAPTFTVVGPPTFTVTDDVNSGVITSIATGPYELPVGTVLKTHLSTEISTQATRAGSAFTAALANDVLSQGRVLLPAGSIITGRIAQIHGGRRISGGSAIRLQAQSVTLPDGTSRHLDAEVIDLDHFQDSRVTSEGTIVSNGHGKATAAILGATTGTAVVAGAMIGGGVGAVVGLGVGAGVGTVWWLKQDRQQTLPLNTEIVFSLDAPLNLASR